MTSVMMIPVLYSVHRQRTYGTVVLRYDTVQYGIIRTVPGISLLFA